jgi:hypothetical protein
MVIGCWMRWTCLGGRDVGVRVAEKEAEAEAVKNLGGRVVRKHGPMRWS